MARTRKRPRDAEATRATLLERATREFADRGYDGARVDEIALAAGINKRMIYAYFGDKDGLYRAVLEASLGEALGLAREGDVAPGTPLRARAEAVIRRFYEYLEGHPDFVRLLTWEAASRERRGREILLARLETGLEPLHAIVRQGVARGDFRKDLEPRAFFLAVNALLLGYFNVRHLVEALWRRPLDGAAGDGVLQQFLRILLDGIGAQKP